MTKYTLENSEKCNIGKSTAIPKDKKEVGIEKELVTWMHHLDVGVADDFFDGCKDVLENIEDIRSNCVDNRDDLVIESGACANKTPDFKKILFGILWRISAQSKGDILNSGIDIKMEDPYFELDKKNGKELKELVDKLIEYIKGIIDLPEKIERFTRNNSNNCHRPRTKHRKFAHRNKKTKCKKILLVMLN